MIKSYYSLILPHIDYCCIIWGLRSKIVIDRLQRFQNKFIRMIFNLSKRTTVRPFLLSLKWQTIEERIKYQFCIVVFKIWNRLTPEYLDCLLLIRTIIYTTRYAQNSKLVVPQVFTWYRKRSPYLFQQTPLPLNIQSSSSLPLFKTCCQSLSHTL